MQPDRTERRATSPHGEQLEWRVVTDFGPDFDRRVLRCEDEADAHQEAADERTVHRDATVTIEARSVSPWVAVSTGGAPESKHIPEEGR